MSNLDDEIRAALRAEDAELFAEYGGELGVMESLKESFRGTWRFHTVGVWVFTLVLLGIAIWTAVRFFEATTVQAQVAWAAGFLYSTLMIMAMKVWYWMQLNKIALIHEIKRVELELARLSRRLQG